MHGLRAYSWCAVYFISICLSDTCGKHLISGLQWRSMWGPVLYTNLLATPVMCMCATHHTRRVTTTLLAAPAVLLCGGAPPWLGRVEPPGHLAPAGLAWSAERARGWLRRSGANGASRCMRSRASSASPSRSLAGAAALSSRPHATPCWASLTRCSQCSPTSSCGTTTPRPPPRASRVDPRAARAPPLSYARSPRRPRRTYEMEAATPLPALAHLPLAHLPRSVSNRSPPTLSPKSLTSHAQSHSLTSHAQSHSLRAAGGARVSRRLLVLYDCLPPCAAAAPRARARTGEHRIV